MAVVSSLGVRRPRISLDSVRGNVCLTESTLQDKVNERNRFLTEATYDDSERRSARLSLPPGEFLKALRTRRRPHEADAERSRSATIGQNTADRLLSMPT
jgi:hypothetical protein